MGRIIPPLIAELFGLIRLLAGGAADKNRIMESVLLPMENRRKDKKLLDQVRDVIRRKQFSIRTEQSYLDWIRRFILFHQKRHPREMSETEVNEFLSYLAREKNVAASTQNQHV